MKARSRSVRSILVGFGVALLLLYVLVSVVGIGDVTAALLSANRANVAAAYLVALGWMVSWSYTLHLILGVLGVPTSRWRSLLVYLQVLFANDVAPFSVGGGEPIAALFVSRSTRTNYETAFLSVMGTDVINFLPAPAFAFVGLLYVAATTALGRQLEIVAGALLGVSALLVLLGVLGWRSRRRIEVRAVTVVVAMGRVTARVVPGVRLPTPADVEARIDAFVAGLERIAADRRVVVPGLASSALGWLLQATVLWVSLSAVGAHVPVAVPVFVVTIVTVTDLAPVPGGIGTVDATLVVLLVAVTGVPAATATAAALVFRSATLLFPIVLGGVTVAVLQLDLG